MQVVSIVFSLRSMVYGLRSMVYGLRSTVYGDTEFFGNSGQFPSWRTSEDTGYYMRFRTGYYIMLRALLDVAAAACPAGA